MSLVKFARLSSLTGFTKMTRKNGVSCVLYIYSIQYIYYIYLSNHSVIRLIWGLESVGGGKGEGGDSFSNLGQY